MFTIKTRSLFKFLLAGLLIGLFALSTVDAAPVKSKAVGKSAPAAKPGRAQVPLAPGKGKPRARPAKPASKPKNSGKGTSAVRAKGPKTCRASNALDPVGPTPKGSAKPKAKGAKRKLFKREGERIINENPTPQDLIVTAKAFSQWVNSVYPGTNVVVAGGAAIHMTGGSRSTKDLDVALEFTQKGATTNTLKDRAAQLTDRFIVGPKIFFAYKPNNFIQVDFIDAKLYFNPWSPEMITTMRDHPDVHVLSPTTLLIQKIITIQERCSGEKLAKMMNDAIDILHLLRQATTGNIMLSNVDKEIIKKYNGGPNAIKTAWDMMEQVKTGLNPGVDYSAQFKAGWNKYATLNGFDATWQIQV